MKRIIIFITALFFYGSCFAQFTDSVHHRASFSSTGIINKTKDVSSYVLNNSIGFSIDQKKFSQNTAASWIYGKQLKTLSNNDWSVYADFDYLKNVQKLYYWALVNFDKSYSLKINYRFQSGAGIGYNVAKQPDLNIIVSDGFVYETSDLTDPLLGKDIYQTVRNSFRVKYYWSINKVIVFSGSNFVQPSILSLKDYILKLNNTVSIKLNNWLALNATVGYDKISRTNRENLLITYGLTFDRYF